MGKKEESGAKTPVVAVRMVEILCNFHSSGLHFQLKLFLLCIEQAEKN